MINYIFIAILSYLIGAIPSTYFIVKILTNKIISQEGTGNVGAMNSFEVTGKKYIGILSFLGDFSKGILAVLLSSYLFDNTTLSLGLALIFAVIGHNASIFLKFKGGRGLSTAVGGLILINPILVLFWIISYLAYFFIIKKEIHKSNLFATFVSAILLWFAPDDILQIFNTTIEIKVITYKIVCSVVCLIIIIAHNKQIFANQQV